MQLTQDRTKLQDLLKVEEVGAVLYVHNVLYSLVFCYFSEAAYAGGDDLDLMTLNGWTLPHRMNGGVKEFHLVAEPVERELADGMVAHLWGYNGQSTGPTIEAVEGDRVRIYVTNKLPEATTIHWHGMILPSGMDGVALSRQ